MLKRLIRLWPFHNLKLENLTVHWLVQEGMFAQTIMSWWVIDNSKNPTMLAAYRRYREKMDEIHDDWWRQDEKIA